MDWDSFAKATTLRVFNQMHLIVGHCSAVQVSSLASSCALEADSLQQPSHPCDGQGTIKRLCREGRLKEALSVLDKKMDELAVQADINTCLCLLQECSNMKSVSEGKQVHAYIIRSGLTLTVSLWDHLLNMYMKCECMEEASLVFNQMGSHSLVSWNLMITAYAKRMNAKEAFECFVQMLQEGIKPDVITYLSILKACSSTAVLKHGKQIHEYIITSGYKSDVYVGNGLIDMYSNCGSMADAHDVFVRMVKWNVVSWNMLISGYDKGGHSEEALKVFWHMIWDGTRPNHITFLTILKACGRLGCLEKGKQLHSSIIKSRLETNLLVGSALIDMYTKCGSPEHARKVFDLLPKRNVVSWTSMIAGYVQHGIYSEALKLFWQMEQESVNPNTITFLSILKACCNASALEHGKQIHAHINKSGYGLDVILQSCLVDMYAKCGSLEDARYVFGQMARHDVISWNVMIAGYIRHGFAEDAVELFIQMEQKALKPTETTVVGILQACTSLQAIEQGYQIHSQVVKTWSRQIIFVNNTLVDMYIKCGHMEDASEVFNQMVERDVISWNIVIAGHIIHGNFEEALKLFLQMQQEAVLPDDVTFLSMLQACGSLGALELGKGIHVHITGIEHELDVSVWNTIVDMYAKCGNIANALHVFHDTPKQSIVSWNVAIAGCALNGCGKEALALFEQMQLEGVRLDHITFVAVLSACSHAGLVDEGRQYLTIMTQQCCITPTEEHYVCMVDLLGRAGHLKEAQEYIKEMQDASAVVWKALLGACRIHGDVDLAQHVTDSILALELEDSAAFVLLSNIYATTPWTWEDHASGNIDG